MAPLVVSWTGLQLAANGATGPYRLGLYYRCRTPVGGLLSHLT